MSCTDHIELPAPGARIYSVRRKRGFEVYVHALLSNGYLGAATTITYTKTQAEADAIVDELNLRMEVLAALTS